MAQSAGDSHESPIYGAHYRVGFPILDADGDLVTAAAGLDSEISKDTGTFTDCSNEATEIAASSGIYYLDITGAEMTASMVAIIVKTSTSGAKTTPIILYPKRMHTLESGTAQAGAGSTVTLAAGASAKDSFYNGLYVLITNNSPAGAQYQARRVISYVGSTRVATVEAAWGTNPSSASTYDILVPDAVDTTAWAGTRVTDPTTLGMPNVNLSQWVGSAPSAIVQGLVQSLPSLLHTGTAQAGGANSITLAAGASATNDFYKGSVVLILSGTGALQSAVKITGYVGATKVAAVTPSFKTNPDNTSIYVVLPASLFSMYIGNK